MKKVLLVIVGIVSIFLAIKCFGYETGSYVSTEKYGGDAYTGIQNASSKTANNVMYLSEITKFGFGSVLLIAGLSLVVCNIPTAKAENEGTEN